MFSTTGRAKGTSGCRVSLEPIETIAQQLLAKVESGSVIAYRELRMQRFYLTFFFTENEFLFLFLFLFFCFCFLFFFFFVFVFVFFFCPMGSECQGNLNFSES